MTQRLLAGALYHGRLWAPYFRLRGQRRRPASAVLFTFHRIVDAHTPYLFKGPTVQTPVAWFERLMAGLRRYYDMVSLDQVVQHLESGQPFARDCVAVTFDDGYEDNYRLALPILRRYGIPATVFLATGFIGTGRWLWMDRLEQALLQTCRPHLELEPLGLPGRLPLAGLVRRRQANLRLSAHLKTLAPPALEAALAALEQALAVDPGRYRRTMLTWEEVRALARAGVDIGSHGVSHVILTQMPRDQALAELESSKTRLEAELQRPVRHFAYPNGRAEDFDETLCAAARGLGYRSVSTCIWGRNTPSETDTFALRRIGIGGDLPICLLRVERLLHAGAGEARETA
ncbi:MAG TPA: polysaccharide deacetylase family protein [Candidatus Competibacteraceae bacterium]|nr:polysaccharide deacetylase family protein [Candidatus Competibacteraceae bacterium]